MVVDYNGIHSEMVLRLQIQCKHCPEMANNNSFSGCFERI